MATLVLSQPNANLTATNYYQDEKLEATSSGWFVSTNQGIVFAQLSGNGITYNSYNDPLLGTITSARSINESGDTNWLVTGIGVAASDTSDLYDAFRYGNAFSYDMVNIILSGDDTIIGSAENDSFVYSAGDDYVDGKDGIDIINFSEYMYRSNEYDSLIVNLAENQYEVTTNANVVITSSIYNIENVIGSNQDDQIFGDAADNRLFGGYGDDLIKGGAGDDYIDSGNDSYYDGTKLYGEDGNDFIIGDGGNTYIDGGAGVDTVSYFGKDLGVNVNLTDSVGKHGNYNSYYNTWSYTDTLLNIENVVGSTWNDTILGNSYSNKISGGAGNDSLNGGTGIDTIDFLKNGYQGVKVNLSTNVATGQGTDAIFNFENVLGSNHNDTIIGDTLNNALYGNSGNDILDGGIGVDTMIGGLGNDTYYVDNVGDILSEVSTLYTETDTILSSVSQTLGANIENLTLTGTTTINGTGNVLANTLTGNSAANILNADSGNDVLNGGRGNDTLTGGAGRDIFVFDSILNASTNKDSITDFIVVDDTVRLDKTIFTKLATGTLKADNFRSSTDGAAADTNDYILYNRSNGALFYDKDGSGTGGAIQFATLTTHPNITAADFAVIA